MRQQSAHKAVVLGTNYYIGLSVLRCLGAEGIYTVAVDYESDENYGAFSRYCCEKVTVPYYKENPEGFIAALIDYAKRQSEIPVLIACHDSYVEMLDRYVAELKPHFLMIQDERRILSTVIDKGKLHKLALEHGVRVPETVRLDEEDFKERIDNIIHYPCIVKPVDSAAFVATFRRKLYIVKDEAELMQVIEKVKPSGLEVVVQRIIQGFDDHMYTFDAFVDDAGEVTHWMTCQKYRQYPINYGASVYTIQKHVPELYDIGSAFFKAIGYKGFGEIEFKKDAQTGAFYLIEINARTTNLNVLLYKAGINFPYLHYCLLTGTPTVPKAVTHDTGLAFWYGYEDMIAIRDYIKTGQLTLGQVVGTLLTKRKACAIWDLKDMKPYWMFMKRLLKKIMKVRG